jgi:class 3 adenylate cyclase/tetratricopeptide (TPR) repeat protein
VQPGAREQRKTVTVLFCDLTGSTALGESVDPERLRALLARYFERMKAIVERHGGSVEKFIGDAVMAVFGVPVLHEDDALRAVRAAVEMRDALPELGLEGRIGVMTGEVVTGTEERLATGDAVNVAARLEQAAEPGTILIGRPTLALVADAVDAEAVPPLALKGKAEPVEASRVLRVHDAPQRRHDERFVGRTRELALVHETFARARTEQRSELVTIVGDAGVGKSRLVGEALAALDATSAYGRCPPYGEGITYWPVVEVLKQLRVLARDDGAAAAMRALLGETELRQSAEDIAWGFRKTLERAAENQPLVVVFDDLQWGEQTFLDLIEHVALLSSGAPIVLLCLARPEFVESHPAWQATLRLEPLPDADVGELIEERVPEHLRANVARAAGGNPLFIHEMVAMLEEAGGNTVPVPPTLRALLAARLDQLEASERAVLERASIEGEIFHRGSVQALAPEEPQVTPQLAALVRKRLIRPDKPQLPGEDAFRFHHLLLRDAAYDALPKAVRADLHERHARWLERHEPNLVEVDEVVGYHLEQACRYREELGLPLDAHVAREARERLRSGGRRAALRQDYRAAASLLERAAALVPPQEVDFPLERDVMEALFWIGRGSEVAGRADAVAARAAAAGDRIGELCARIEGARSRVGSEAGANEKVRALVEEALPVFEAAEDDFALFVALDALTETASPDAALDAYERAFEHAARAGHLPTMDLATRSSHRFFGSTPVAELLEWLDANEPPGRSDRFVQAYRAGALAMRGRFGEARAILAEMRAELADRRAGVLLANITAFESVWVERWAGDPGAALAFAETAWRLYLEVGEEGFLGDAAAERAHILYELDRLDEADAWAERAAELADQPRALWRSVQAKLLARRGEQAQAERAVREALALSADLGLNLEGDIYADAAEVFVIGGKRDDARAALEEALDRYERKGNVVSAARVQERLNDLAAATTRR